MRIMRCVARPLLLPWYLLQWLTRTKLGMLVFACGVLGLFATGSVEAYHYWASPSFCRSCHSMEEQYLSLEDSPHKGVACSKCHFEPGIEDALHGKWVALKQLASAFTGRYSSMAYAAVSDDSCLRSGCHDREALAEPVEFSKHGIEFTHDSHLGELRGGIELSCTACHHQRLISQHMEVDKSTCFLCHFKGAEAVAGGNCDICHGPPSAPSKVGRFDVDHEKYVERGMACVQCHVELSSGAAAVDKERCLSCHNEPELVARFGDSLLLHVEHVTKRAIHCHQCHEFIDHGVKTSDSDACQLNQDCMSCHSVPHSPQAMLYAGKGAKGVEVSADDMHRVGLDCTACHKAKYQGKADGVAVEAAVGNAFSSCSSCHAEGYGRIAEAMDSSFQQMIAHLDKRVASVQAVLGQKTADVSILKSGLRAKLEDTESNLSLLRRAHAIHNPGFAIKVLRKGDRDLTAVEAALETPLAGAKPMGFHGQDCTVCHSYVWEAGQKIHHGPFAIGACSTCHEPHGARRAGGARIRGREACFGCHDAMLSVLESSHTVHDPVAKDCSLCHEFHSSNFEARLRNERRSLCTNCHEVAKKVSSSAYHGALTTQDGCANCHETHASRFPKLLKGEVRDICLGCHTEAQTRPDGSLVAAVGKDVSSDPEVHGQIRAGDCSSCHDPHGAAGVGLLRSSYSDKMYEPYTRATYDLCFSCHDPKAFETAQTLSLTKFRNGARNLHFYHVKEELKGLNCRTCHETHSSHNPMRLRAELPYAKYILEVKFVRTPGGGSCGPGCHEKRGYGRLEAVVNVPPKPPAGKRVPWPKKDGEEKRKK